MKQIIRAVMDANGIALLPCPAGKELRVIAVALAVSNTLVGDSVSVLMAYEDVVIIRATSPALTVTNVNVVAFIGASGSVGVEDSSAALPDVWLDKQVTVTASPAGGVTFESGNILYELRDGKRL